MRAIFPFIYGRSSLSEGLIANFVAAGVTLTKHGRNSLCNYKFEELDDAKKR
jgi:hypothetical protein